MVNLLNDKQEKYLQKVNRILIAKVYNSDFVAVYEVEIEFINRVLGDLFYTDEDRSRLNGLARLSKTTIKIEAD